MIKCLQVTFDEESSKNVKFYFFMTWDQNYSQSDRWCHPKNFATTNHAMGTNEYGTKKCRVNIYKCAVNSQT